MIHFLVSGLLAAALSVFPSWKEGMLDIHMIASDYGENTFVVMPDGTTMLIDAGDPKAEVVSRYIRHFSPRPDGLDYFFLTHFHKDHIGGAEAVEANFRIGRKVDRNNFMPGSHNQFFPLSATVPGFDVFNIAGNGWIATENGTLCRPLSPEDPENFDENMLSCAILLRYGPFSYYTGGDLPGSNFYVKQFKGGNAVSPVIKANDKVEYRSFESQVADLVGPVTAMKLNHHGVPDATTSDFLWKMRPEVMLVAGFDHKQPCPLTLRRIADPQLPCAHKLYVTTDSGKKGSGSALWKSVVAGVGHIVLRVSDGGRRYQVFVLDRNFRVVSASPCREVISRRPDSPDIHLESADDFGCIDEAADSVWRAVTVFAGTDEIHSMMILKDGKKIYEKYDTGHRPDERHVMWSASKTFTAIAVGFAVQESLFGIDDKVISFFHDDELPSERGEWLEKLCIRDLLTMSSGLGTDGINKVRSLEWQHPAREVLAVPMAFEPGARYHYNSMNTYLLSEIVQRCTGMKLSEYLNIRLFRPLGICNWEWEESADGVTAGGWGLYTTTETLAKTAQFLLNKGKWNGRQLLRPEWVEAMSSPQIYQSDGPRNDWNAGYGYQMWVCTHNAFRLDGAFGQFGIVIPEKNAVIAVTAQLNKGKRNFMDLIWKTIWPRL